MVSKRSEALKIGDRVRLRSSRECGIVLLVWANEHGDRDCYVAFYGEAFPDHRVASRRRKRDPKRPYVLRYYETSLARVRDDSGAVTDAVVDVGAGTSLHIHCVGAGAPEDEPPGTSPEQAARQLQAWDDMQSELTHLSTNAVQVVARKSRHYIPVGRAKARRRLDPASRGGLTHARPYEWQRAGIAGGRQRALVPWLDDGNAAFDVSVRPPHLVR